MADYEKLQHEILDLQELIKDFQILDSPEFQAVWKSISAEVKTMIPSVGKHSLGIQPSDHAFINGMTAVAYTIDGLPFRLRAAFEDKFHKAQDALSKLYAQKKLMDDMSTEP